jgi:hypothetical protein
VFLHGKIIFLLNARRKNLSEVCRTRGVPRWRGCPACLYLPQHRVLLQPPALLCCTALLSYCLLCILDILVKLWFWFSKCDDMLHVLGIHCEFCLFAGMLSASILSHKTISYRALHCPKLRKLLPRTISLPCITSLLSCTILFDGDP